MPEDIMDKISQEDLNTWNSYISNLYQQPETSFKPKKARQDESDILDLHGMTIQTAFNKTRTFLERHFDIGSKIVTIVTGKSGKIAEEFPHWINNLHCVRELEALTDTRGQCGAYIIRLKKSR